MTACQEAILAPDIELPVAFDTVTVAVDVGDVVPESEDDREMQRVRRGEYRAVGGLRGGL